MACCLTFDFRLLQQLVGSVVWNDAVVPLHSWLQITLSSPHFLMRTSTPFMWSLGFHNFDHHSVVYGRSWRFEGARIGHACFYPRGSSVTYCQPDRRKSGRMGECWFSPLFQASLILAMHGLRKSLKNWTSNIITWHPQFAAKAQANLVLINKQNRIRNVAA